MDIHNKVAKEVSYFDRAEIKSLLLLTAGLCKIIIDIL